MKDNKIIAYTKKKSRMFFLDYLKLIFRNFQELRGDRCIFDDRSIIGGIAKLDNKSVLIIGQQNCQIDTEKRYFNYGMTSPWGYRKALRLFKLAEKFELPIITFIDTPGASPSIEAEKNCQNISIATNIKEMFLIKTPIISIIIGEGCSGGALGISICDKLIMMEKSYFSVISAEGCASILSVNKKENLIDFMQIVPKKLIKLKIIDNVINNYKYKYQLKKKIKIIIKKYIDELENISINNLLKKREKKFKIIGII